MDYPVYFVTTNYNTLGQIALSKLSLYSIFEGAGKLPSARIVLVDSASTDGSFEKLRDLGMELSARTGVDFEWVRLRKDLGNSFALAYGILLARKRGARYAFTVDNDYVLLDSEAPPGMVELAEKLGHRFRVYSVGAFHYEASRAIVREWAGGRDPSIEELEALYAKLKSSQQLLLRAIANTNISYVDILGRPVIIPRLAPALLVEKPLRRLREVRRHAVFVTSYVASTFALYRCSCAPVVPYLYIFGDDQVSGVIHAKRGYLNLVIPIFAGVHFSIDRGKVSPQRMYFEARNYVLASIADRRPARLLHYMLSVLHYSLVYPLLNITEAKSTLVGSKARREFRGASAPVVSVNIGDLRLLRTGVLGAVHGVLSAGRFRRLLDEWLDTYLGGKAGESVLQYVLLDVSSWTLGPPSLKDIALYVYPGPKLSNPRRELRIFLKRVASKTSPGDGA